MTHDFPIDIIFPYVDSTDIIWQQLYLKYVNEGKKEDDPSWTEWSTGMLRFRSNGLLKFVFRSIEKNVPWVNKVYMIVQSETQIPGWVNRDKVNIVYHHQFIPSECLPTFNSSTIEMFIHNIEELSENFIYINDDVFFTSKNNINDYFENDKLVYGVVPHKINLKFPGNILRLKDQELLGIDTETVLHVQHSAVPYKKSIMKKVYEEHEEEILNSVTRFRDKKNYNQWIFSMYAYANDMIINRKLSILLKEIKKKSMSMIMGAKWSYYKTICLNDSSETIDKQMIRIYNKFKRLFPYKSVYEK